MSDSQYTAHVGPSARDLKPAGHRMPVEALDGARMQVALELARSSFGLTEPNPRVGCVIGKPDGTVLGTGATQQAGGPHAEVMALRDAQSRGHSLRGATAWVTLEPCAHYGRTPPCFLALIEAGIARCVVAVLDPFPAVAGAGVAGLRAAGVQVDVFPDDPTSRAAREVNVGFFSRVERGRPWVRVKMAASADGQVALDNGQSQWITGPEARADGHLWRKRASAVLTGIGTVLADDPRLDVRAVATPRQPLRVVLDTRLRTPLHAALLKATGNVLLIGTSGHTEAASALRAAGVEVWDQWPGTGRPALTLLLQRLAERGVNELHVEAGPTLVGALAAADLVDEWLLYLAPTVLGPGMPLTRQPPLQALALARRFQWLSAEHIGKDMRLRMTR